MNNSQFHKIKTEFQYWKILNELTDELFEDWNSWSKEELLRKAMIKSKGFVNPAKMKQIIEDL
jgi:hypothetical protein